MSHVFDTAVCMAQKMAAPKQHITITMGGLPSLMKDMDINGQPHELSYITPDEGNLLQQLGGSGNKVNGIPAYYMGGDFGQGWGDAEDAASADDSMTEDEFSRGLDPGTGWGLDIGANDPETWTTRSFARGLPEPGPAANLVSAIVTPGIVGLLDALFGTKGQRGITEAISKLGHTLTGKVTATGEAPGPGQLGLFDAPPAPPAFDEESPGGKDPTKMLEEKSDEEEEKKKSIMSKYFEDLLKEEEEDEEEDDVEGYNPQTGEATAGVDLSFLEGLPGDLQDILKTSYGEEIMNTGLPSVRKQGRMA
jgi:hypothetical protein